MGDKPKEIAAPADSSSSRQYALSNQLPRDIPEGVVSGGLESSVEAHPDAVGVIPDFVRASRRVRGILARIKGETTQKGVGLFGQVWAGGYEEMLDLLYENFRNPSGHYGVIGEVVAAPKDGVTLEKFPVILRSHGSGFIELAMCYNGYQNKGYRDDAFAQNGHTNILSLNRAENGKKQLTQKRGDFPHLSDFFNLDQTSYSPKAELNLEEVGTQLLVEHGNKAVPPFLVALPGLVDSYLRSLDAKAAYFLNALTEPSPPSESKDLQVSPYGQRGIAKP